MIEILCFQGRSLISKLIQWQTRSRFSHVALRNADTGEVIEAWHVPLFRGGRVYRHADMTACMAIHDPRTRIEVLRLRTMTEARGEQVALGAWRWAEGKVGAKYDLRMVLRFLPRLGEVPSTRTRWFCSELVAAACEVGGFPLLKRILASYVTPRDVYSSPALTYDHAEVWDASTGTMIRAVDVHPGGIL